MGRRAHKSRFSQAAEVKGPPPFLVLARRGPIIGVGIALVIWAWVCTAAYLPDTTLPFFSIDLWVRLLPSVGEMRGAALFGHGKVIAWFLVFLIGLTIFGRGVLSRVAGGVALNPWEALAFSYGIGAGIWGMAMFALAAAGWLKGPVVHSFFCVAVLMGLWLGRRKPLRYSGSPKKLWSAESAPLALFTVFALSLIALFCLTPEIFYDSLVYHLALPSLYKLEGGLVPTPTNLYSGIPMHMEMLYLWALYGGGPLVAKLIHFSMGLGFVVATLGLSLRRSTPWGGWAACAIYFSVPLVGMNLWKTAVDNGSVFFLTLAVAALMIVLDNSGESESPPGLFYLSAFFAGIALSIKYTNGPSFIVLLVSLVVGRRIAFKKIAAYGLIGAGILAPWLIKNTIFYRNPIFPFFHGEWFPGSPTPVDWRGLSADAWARSWGSLLRGGGRPLWEAFAHPWYVTMKGRSDADFLGLLPLIVVPVLIFFKPISEGSRLAWRTFVGLWIAWFLMTAMPRMFLPGVALLSIVSGMALADLTKGWGRAVLTIALSVFSLNGFSYVMATAQPMDLPSVMLGKIDGPAYLKGTHSTYPTPAYASMEWINTNASPDARVLVVGDARGFYLERPFRASSVFDTNLFWFYVDQSETPEALAQRLIREGFTHLLVNFGETLRLRHSCPAKKTSSPDVAEVFFKTHTLRRFEERNMDGADFRWTQVLEIVPQSVAPRDNEETLLDIYRYINK